MLADLIAIGVIPTGGEAVPDPTTPTAISLALVKLHLRIRHTDEDDLLSAYIAASQAYIEQHTQKLLTRREVTQEHPAFTTHFTLYWGPSPDTISVTYIDADDAEQEITDARAVRDRLYAPTSSGWPSTADYSPVFITYTAGYATDTVPSDIIAAQLLLIGHWYENRSIATAGVTTELPLTVKALLEPYRALTV